MGNNPLVACWWSLSIESMGVNLTNQIRLLKEVDTSGYQPIFSGKGGWNVRSCTLAPNRIRSCTLPVIVTLEKFNVSQIHL
jgi:hypothetical protein